MAKILTTSDLVITTRRRASIPAEETAFSDQDVIDILNEEMQSYIMPIVIRLHEDFYLYDDQVSIESNKTKYKIPYRATGNKLYDVQYQDAQGNKYEMSRTTVGARPEYSDYYKYRDHLKFYAKGDSIVILDDNPRATDSLVFTYYLSPNELVKDVNGAKITAIGNEFETVTISSYADLPTDTITINGFTLTAVAAGATGKQFNAEIDNPTSATNLANLINSDSDTSAIVTASVDAGVITINAISSSTELSISYADNTGTSGLSLNGVSKSLTLDAFPSSYSSQPQFDFIQGTNPSTIVAFDISIQSTNSTTSILNFLKSDLPTDVIVGDYVCRKQETIVAQMPQELQPLLAQKAACKLLESLGDLEGSKLALTELQRLERNLNTIIDNRVDEANLKVKNRFSPLREARRNTSTRRL